MLFCCAPVCLASARQAISAPAACFRATTSPHSVLATSTPHLAISSATMRRASRFPSEPVLVKSCGGGSMAKRRANTLSAAARVRNGSSEQNQGMNGIFDLEDARQVLPGAVEDDPSRSRPAPDDVVASVVHSHAAPDCAVTYDEMTSLSAGTKSRRQSEPIPVPRAHTYMPSLQPVTDSNSTTQNLSYASVGTPSIEDSPSTALLRRKTLQASWCVARSSRRPAV